MGEHEHEWHSWEDWLSGKTLTVCRKCGMSKSVAIVSDHEDKSYSAGFAAGLEAGAEMAEEKASQCWRAIHLPAPLPAEVLFRAFAGALRERAREEKSK